MSLPVEAPYVMSLFRDTVGRGSTSFISTSRKSLIFGILRLLKVWIQERDHQALQIFENRKKFCTKSIMEEASQNSITEELPTWTYTKDLTICWFRFHSRLLFVLPDSDESEALC